MNHEMTKEEIEKLKDMAFDMAVERFPYTNEGDLEDDIDVAKRFIYQMGIVKGYEKALASLPEPEIDLNEAWISVEDRLLEENQYVYLYGKGGRQFSSMFKDGEFLAYNPFVEGFEVAEEITHWREQPAPPLSHLEAKEGWG